MRLSVCMVIFSLLLHSSCKEDCDPGNLDNEERAWITYFGGEQIIFFSSQLQTYDTAYATTPHYEFYAGGYSQGQDDCGPHGTEGGDQQLVFVNGNFQFVIGAYHDYGRMGTSASLNGNQIPEDGVGSMVILGHTYTDVRVIQLDSSACADQYIWRYYLNQEYGVLKFERKNGPSWELY